MNYYLKVLQNYATFSGRARRSEYWYFVLFNMIFAIVAVVLDNVFGTAIEGVGYGLIYGLYVLAVLLPGLAVAVRRLHDVGKSGWMFLIGLIPLIGPIWLLVLFCTDSQQGSNKWGENPKEITTPSNENSNSTSSDKLLITYLCIAFFVFISGFAIGKLVDNPYEGPIKYVRSSLWILRNLGLILIPLSIKNKSLKIIGLILTIIMAIYWTYADVEFMIS